jgi:2,4-didehydro-3-deoxy-L-rhamnonate hydrolase
VAEAIASEWRSWFGRDAPGKIICIGLNYRDHAEEQGGDLPREPLMFAKFANALLDPGEPIVLPREATHVDAEAELALVIGRTVRRSSEEEALGAVAGYVAANDVSARNLQFADGQWLRGKSFDTFCPLSLPIVPAADVRDAGDLRVVQRVNERVLQDSRTSALIFGIPAVVAHAASVFTLEPGDLILTGTPAGVGIFRDPPVALRPGDAVQVDVEGVGTVRSPVVAEE